nr:MAG TPA: hypothetical protein [Caudoviricetes sp.]
MPYQIGVDKQSHLWYNTGIVKLVRHKAKLHQTFIK